jgi:hypothetical protein
MSHDIPWVGLVAILLMFILPALPAWLFEGPRTIRHRPIRHVCGVCGARWTDGHLCAPLVDQERQPIQAELHRLDSRLEVEGRADRR